MMWTVNLKITKKILFLLKVVQRRHPMSSLGVAWLTASRNYLTEIPKCSDNQSNEMQPGKRCLFRCCAKTMRSACLSLQALLKKYNIQGAKPFLLQVWNANHHIEVTWEVVGNAESQLCSQASPTGAGAQTQNLAHTMQALCH
jgi:hypothetical protein